eukprot:CAMPEP_0185856432 /NCGR_PEP_ID=MMETSP1354-20130828/28989_1 /TAXON_ID=708628 /ORGANISM="Erythrolobus madagascarensis, Strain CCMP3276" /LENGTH=313 /DNA_ID=CAMNT_0028558679 /DNA_START=236 /DNA_END=1180 /DNA_ORIENTATION=-
MASIGGGQAKRGGQRRGSSVRNEEMPAVVEVYDAHTHLGCTLEQLKQRVSPENVHGVVSREGDVQKVSENVDGTAFELKGCINVNCWANKARSKSFEAGLKFQQELSNVYGTYGLHPHYAKDWSDTVEQRMRSALADEKSVAVGECGLDFYRNLSDADVQTSVFVKQIRIARELNLPLVIHARDAEQRALEVLSQELPGDWPIHLHCYTGPVDVAQSYLKRFDSLCIGFTGCITFKKSDAIRDVVAVVPLERMLLETDAPYMAPIPFRGKVCHAGMTPLVAAKVAEIKDVSVEKVASTTSANCERLYRLPTRS